jgi:hypothetical protein
VIGTTGGRFIIDISCGVIPQQLVRGGFFVLTAAMTAALYLILKDAMGLSVILSTGVAWVFGFGFRLTAQALGWEEWEPWEPAELKAGEKAHKTLIDGLHAELDPPKRGAP